MKTHNKISVFLVDDDGLYLTIFEHYLEERLGEQIQLELFENGEDCLKAIKKNPLTDVVVLDYCLNTEESSDAMNGIGVLKKIKKYNPDIIVIMLSAQDKKEIADACIRYGAYEYVIKSETAFIRTQNILKNLIQEVSLQSYYTQDIGGES